ncbi:MAG: S41 family peptidase [Elusimicrobiota bacterium]
MRDIHAASGRILVASALLAGVLSVSNRAGAGTWDLEAAFPRATAFVSGARARPLGLPRLMREKDLPPNVLGRIQALSDEIERQHTDPQERTAAFYEGMARLVKDIDPLAEFFTPQAFSKFLAGNEGFYGGIGALLAEKAEGRSQVIDYPLPGSPGEKAGLLSGDEIIAIDGVDILPLSRQATEKKIRGHEGERIDLTIRRVHPATGAASTFSMSLDRAVVQTPIIHAKMLDGGVGYVYLGSFRDDADKQTLEQLRRLRGLGLSALVLDLRNNLGGSMIPALWLSAAFLKQGQQVMSARKLDGTTWEWAAPWDGEFSDLPVAVLVNGKTASASENLSGALQDHGRAVIVGSRTYGKGTTQKTVPFDDQSWLKLTEEWWYTPKGRSVQKDGAGHGGLEPDVSVSVNESDEFHVMGDIIREMNGAKPRAQAGDAALEAALSRLRM